jgi:hypothetical protein
MDRGNHYEAAFAAYLQEHHLGYVAVDQSRRSLWGPTPVKSLDFILFGQDDARFVVDVKGRRYPGGRSPRPRYTWECWTPREDVEGLERWAELSGPGYRGLFVFMYHVLPCVKLPENTPDLWDFRGRRYLLRAVPSADYRDAMRPRSPSWQTVTLPQAVFRSLVRPLGGFVRRHEAEECPF